MRNCADAYTTLTVQAEVSNLPDVLEFVDTELESVGCDMKTQMMIEIAAEELYTNIAKYAYEPGTGEAVIRIRHLEDPKAVEITFEDSGIPYDPLAKEDPDVTMPAEEREIGGLGIFMVKKSMDEVTYEFSGGHNIVRIPKLL